MRLIELAAIPNQSFISSLPSLSPCPPTFPSFHHSPSWFSLSSLNLHYTRLHYTPSHPPFLLPSPPHSTPPLLHLRARGQHAELTNHRWISLRECLRGQSASVGKNIEPCVGMLRGLVHRAEEVGVFRRNIHRCEWRRIILSAIFSPILSSPLLSFSLIFCPAGNLSTYTFLSSAARMKVHT